MRNGKNITVDAVESTSAQKKIVKTSKYDPKNYLNDRLEDGEDEKKIRIRLLTIDKDSCSPFHHIKMHNVKVPKEVSPSGFKSYICLEHTQGPFNETMGNKCPFCELNRKAYNAFKTETNDVAKEHYKQISLQNLTTDVGIIRCIERGHEADGPKFWKFNIRQDKKDPENQMMNIYKTRKAESIDEAKDANGGELPADFVPDNIFDIDNGKDFLITITRVFDKEGKPTDKRTITISDYGKFKPLTEDEAQCDAWLEDEKRWHDVFVAKPYEYLMAIINGETPWFDKANNKWSTKSEVLGNKNDEQKAADTVIDNADKNIKEMSSVIDNDDDDDLPY